jgi:hypothetical protein
MSLQQMLGRLRTAPAEAVLCAAAGLAITVAIAAPAHAARFALGVPDKPTDFDTTHSHSTEQASCLVTNVRRIVLLHD